MSAFDCFILDRCKIPGRMELFEVDINIFLFLYFAQVQIYAALFMHLSHGDEWVNELM